MARLIINSAAAVVGTGTGTLGDGDALGDGEFEGLGTGLLVGLPVGLLLGLGDGGTLAVAVAVAVAVALGDGLTEGPGEAVPGGGLGESDGLLDALGEVADGLG